MSRLDRFRNLERQRPDRPDDATGARAGASADPAPHTSGRFGKIEPRPQAREQPGDDAFAPPPDREPHLVISEDDRDRGRQLRAERLHHMSESAIEGHGHAQAHAEAEPAPPPHAKMDLQTRLLLGATGLVAIAALAIFVTPVAWGLAPILIIGLGAGLI